MVRHLNLFLSNAFFLYPLKTSENLKGCIGNEWIKSLAAFSKLLRHYALKGYNQ